MRLKDTDFIRKEKARLRMHLGIGMGTICSPTGKRGYQLMAYMVDFARRYKKMNIDEIEEPLVCHICGFSTVYANSLGFNKYMRIRHSFTF